MKEIFIVPLAILLMAGLIFGGCAKPAAAPATIKPETVIDMYTHVTPAKFKDALFEVLPKDSSWVRTIGRYTVFSDMEERIKDMEGKAGMAGYKQVITIMQPALETVCDPPTAVKLAKLANDGMAEIVKQYPDKFVAAVACLPMNDMDAALKETGRAINELGMKGILIHTPVVDKPLDSPEFIPLYEKMAKYDLPIWIHPQRSPMFSDYKSEKMSKYQINMAYGWPYESTTAMTRLAVSGIMEKYPNLKFIIHHGGAMIPFFQQRISITDAETTLDMPNVYAKRTKPLIEYMKTFYADVANIPAGAVRLSHEFFGTDHMVFGTDYPFGPPLSATIGYVGELGISKAELAKIFETNCKTLLKLK